MPQKMAFIPDGQKPRDVKEYNGNLILSIFRGCDSISVTEMADQTSLSKTTISKIFSRLSMSRVIIPVGRGNSTVEGGKRPTLFALNPDYCYGIVLSVGFADHVSCTIADFTGKSIVNQSQPTTAETSYYEVLRISADLILKSVASVGIPYECICGIAISFDGIVDTVQGIILNAACRNWEGPLHICEDLSSALPFQTDVIVDNACSFAGYAELAFHDLLPGNKMVITWDTNQTLGCTMLAGRQLVINSEGITGGFGHVLIDTASSIPCRCGVKGCLQSVLSKEATREYMSRTWKKYPYSPLTEKFRTNQFEMVDIFRFARDEEPFALDMMSHIVRYFSILIYNVFSLHSAQKIILQGMFALSGNLFLDQLKDGLLNFNRLHIFKDIDIVYSRYVDDQLKTGVSPYTKGASMYLSDRRLGQRNDL